VDGASSKAWLPTFRQQSKARRGREEDMTTSKNDYSEALCSAFPHRKARKVTTRIKLEELVMHGHNFVPDAPLNAIRDSLISMRFKPKFL